MAGQDGSTPRRRTGVLRHGTVVLRHGTGVLGRARRAVALAAAVLMVAAGCSAADRAMITAPRCSDARAEPSRVTHRPGQVVLMGSLIRSDVPPGPIGGWDDVISVAYAGTTAAAVHTDGTVSVVGVNHKGLLGVGLDGPDAIIVPQPVPGVTDAVSVHASGNTFLVVHTNGTVTAWGDAFIADGGKRRGTAGADRVQPHPMRVPGVDSIVTISGSTLNVLALRSDGHVTGWGINLVDSLGEPNGTEVRTLRDRPGAVAVANASGAALTATGTGEVCAWGNNVSGLLGVEPTGGQTTAPVRVAELDRIVSVAGGNDFGLALDEDGAVWAWGRGAGGVLGDRITEDHHSAVPSRVAGLPVIETVATDGFTAFAIDTAGTAWAWGSHMHVGALIDHALPEPTPVPLPGPVQMLSGPLALLDGSAIGRATGTA